MNVNIKASYLYKIRVLILAAGLGLMIALAAMWYSTPLAHAQAVQYHQEDPDNPSVRYVLNKLNTHIGDSLRDRDTLAITTEKLKSLDAEKVGEHFATIDLKLDGLSVMLKSGLGGLVTLILHALVNALKAKKVTDK